MKKILLLLCTFTAIASIRAQSDFAIRKMQFAPGQTRTLPTRGAIQRSSTSSIVIDYDAADRYYVSQNPGGQSDTVFPVDINNGFDAYPVNSNFDTSAYFTLKYAIQTYDQLIDANNNFNKTPLASATITVDSIFLFVSDSNGTGSRDSFNISIFDATAASTTGSGLHENIVTTPLWSRGRASTTNFFGTNLGQYIVLIGLYPSITLPAGHTFGVRVDFYGDVRNSFLVASSFRNDCGTGSSLNLADTNAYAPHNSSFYFNYGPLSGVYDFRANTPVLGAPAPCQYLPIQNFLFTPYLTVSSTCPSISVTATQQGRTAYASATGGAAPYTYRWSTVPAQTTDTAIGLSTGTTYTVTATDNNGCTGMGSVFVTGINGISDITNFSVYPNPSNGQFTASVHLAAASDVMISVIDIMGNTIYQSTDKMVSELSKPMNLSGAAAGIYVVNIKTSTGTVNQRLEIK